MNKSQGISGLSIFLLFLALGRLFLSYQKEVKSEKDAQFFSNIRNSMVQEKEEAADSIASLIKEQGRIFIYTSDTTVDAAWVPNIDYTDYSYTENLMGVNPIFKENDKYKSFLEHHDSLGFYVIFNPGGNGEQRLLPSYTYNGSASKKLLYFMGVYSTDELNADKTISEKYKEKAMLYPAPIWGVGFNDALTLSADSLKNESCTACMKVAKRLKCFHLYMAAVEKDDHHAGVDSISFMKSVQLFNHLLQKSGNDTSRYVVKVFPSAAL
jgi:hypothetical protein